MHVRSLGHLGVNPLQEVEKIGRPVTFVALADHRASRNVERGEQGCRAVADISLGARSAAPGAFNLAQGPAGAGCFSFRL